MLLRASEVSGRGLVWAGSGVLGPGYEGSAQRGLCGFQWKNHERAKHGEGKGARGGEGARGREGDCGWGEALVSGTPTANGP
jgi:hypothetical protein